MLDYARSDTHYLLNIYDHLRNSLLELGSRPPSPVPPTPLAACTLVGESKEDPQSPQEVSLQNRHNPQAALRMVLEHSASTALKLHEREIYADDGSGRSGWKMLLKKSMPRGSEDTAEAAVLKALCKWRDAKARENDDSVPYVRAFLPERVAG